MVFSIVTRLCSHSSTKFQSSASSQMTVPLPSPGAWQPCTCTVCMDLFVLDISYKFFKDLMCYPLCLASFMLYFSQAHFFFFCLVVFEAGSQVAQDGMELAM